VCAGALAAAAPAGADPVKAGPAVPDELAVLTVGGALTQATSYASDRVAINRLSTATGAYRGRIVFPSDGASPLTVSTQYVGSPLRNRTLRRSVDGRYLTFTGLDAAPGLLYQDTSKSTAVRVSADGTWVADVPFGSGYMSSISNETVGTVTVDGSRYWVGTTTGKPLATIAPGDAGLTQLSAGLSASTTGSSVDIVDGSLYLTSGIGVAKLNGLPTAADTTTVPQTVIALPEAFDSAFLDTDGVAGVDTAYVTRGTRGLWKFVLAGGTWNPAGHIAGSFSWVAARAVAGGVELYTTDQLNAKVQKTVDSAPVGGDITTTGVAPIAYAPAGTRYAGVAFAPGTGFPADATPYPATPPSISTSATTLDTSLNVTPKQSVILEVSDPNTAASDLSVTATSSNTAVLPNDKVVITGTGERRTATFDPIAVGSATVTFTVKASGDTKSVTVVMKATGAAPEATGHYYSGLVDLSASLDVGDGYFLGISDEVNVPRLYKKGVTGAPVASFPLGFPGGEVDYEGVTRFGNTVVWTGSHGNNRGGSAKPERRQLAFETITGSGDGVDLTYRNSYTNLWNLWRAWDASNGHGLGANYLKFNTATVPGLIPNAPNGFNVEGLTMAPGSTTEAWFGMRAPTITGADGIERALILPVTNIDKLTSDAVQATFGQPIFLNLGGRSIRDISKNAADQYLIEAGTGDTDDSLKGWALYTWDGNPSHDPQFVNELPTDEARIGAWEGIAELPASLVAGSKVLLTADSGDTGLGKAYGQYVTLGSPVTGPAAVTNVVATPKPGALDIKWDAADRANRYYVTVKNAAGVNAPGSPLFADGTSASLEGLTAGTEYSVVVRSQNVASRSANSTVVKATPTQGARTATTTAIAFGGSNVIGEKQTITATLSDPAATGTVQFFANGSRLQDTFATDPVPTGGNIIRSTFPVVNGKAVIDITDQLPPGITNLQAKFTTANAENFTSSDSAIVAQTIDIRPKLPWAEVTAITGDRVAGSRIGITVKLFGYKQSEVWREPISVEFDDRLPGAPYRTRLTGDTPDTQYGYTAMTGDGEATFYTTALAAGDHRISVYVPNYSQGYVGGFTAEVPLKIAAAGTAPITAPTLKKPTVALVVTGPGKKVTTQPVTLTARVSDPALAGTVEFTNAYGDPLKTGVPVVNGIATYTGVLPGAFTQVYARFEPAADRDSTISPVSFGVTLVRAATEQPSSPVTPTTTTLEVTGDRVVGAPLTANVTVAPVSTDPFADRDVNGYIEVLDGTTVVGFSPTFRGKGTIDLSALGAGTHALSARYVPSDDLRSAASVSAAQNVVLVVKTDASSPVGGSVGATLSLTLGAPASFGSFLPGVAKDYTAQTTATVLSTAGDAALSVSDPGHLVNGAFSLPSPLEVSFSKSAWTAPTSNEAVTIGFKQHIGATDAVRTGAYSKTLTFTLSTTTP
jgi:hypothetical protein